MEHTYSIVYFCMSSHPYPRRLMRTHLASYIAHRSPPHDISSRQLRHLCPIELNVTKFCPTDYRHFISLSYFLDRRWFLGYPLTLSTPTFMHALGEKKNELGLSPRRHGFHETLFLQHKDPTIARQMAWALLLVASCWTHTPLMT